MSCYKLIHEDFAYIDALKRDSNTICPKFKNKNTSLISDAFVVAATITSSTIKFYKKLQFVPDINWIDGAKFAHRMITVDAAFFLSQCKPTANRADFVTFM